MYWLLLNMQFAHSRLLTRHSEALAVNNVGTILVVLLLCDPHGLEGGEGCEDGATEPHGVEALGWSQNFDATVAGREHVNLLPETLAHRLEQRAATTEDDVCEQILSYIVVTLHDRVEAVLVDTLEVVARQAWCEEDLGASEALVTN